MNSKQLTQRISRKHLLWVLVGGSLILLFVILMGGPGKRTEPAREKQRVEVNLLGNADLEKEQWRATAEKEIEGLKVGQKDLTERQKEILEKLNSLADRINAEGRAADRRRPTKESEAASETEFAPLQAVPPSRATSVTAAARTSSVSGPTSPSSPPEAIRTFGPEAGMVGVDVGKGKPREEKPAEASPYLPSGSFVSGVLLSGLDAPAGVNASKEPHPVLIKLADLAVLPNRFRFDIKECFLLGEGYGDLSSERAYIRTTSLSCVRGDGQSVDVPLKGFVAGEDGKVGVRGRVVSKQGQFLAKALVAGFAEGLSDVFRLSATTVSVSPLGATQTIDPKRALEAGAFSGAGRALDRLAQHYINMAERLFPVIEIDAGRKVEVVVLQGRPLAPIEERGK
jgi:conjugal transfer pilus assembly protein TraB